jgi:hypothetical protein
MTRCDNCGVDFEMPKEPVEVTSSKVLCPKCAAERRARIQAQKAAAAAPTKTATAAPAAPAKAPAVAQPAASQQQAAAPPAAARPAAAKPAPAVAAAAAPAARPARAVTAPPPHKEHHHVDLKELKRQRQEELNKIIKIGWMAAGGLLLIGGIIVLLVYSKKSDENARVQAIKDGWEAIFKEISGYKTEDPAQATRLIERANATRGNPPEGWASSPYKDKINTMIKDAQEKLRILQEQKNIRDTIEGITKDLNGQPNPDALEGTFRRIREVKPEAETAGPDFVAKLNDLRKKCNTVFFDTLRARATEEAASAKEGRDLAAHGRLEDLLMVLIGEAQLEKDADGISKWGKAYTEIYRETNAIVNQLFTPEYQNRVKWDDMLKDSAAWTDGGSKTNLKYAVSPAGLTMNLDKDGQAKIAGIYFDPSQNWRDYIVEMDVKLDTGTATFYARASSPDEAKAVLDTQKVSGFSVGTEKVNVQLEYGKSVTIVFSVIGDQFAVNVDGASMPVENTIGKNKSRKGFVAISCKAGSSLTVSRLRYRRLR